MRSELDVMLDGVRSGRRIDSKWARLVVHQHSGVEQDRVVEQIAQAIADGFDPGSMSAENLDKAGIEYHFHCGALPSSIQLSILKKIAQPGRGGGRLVFDEIISNENKQEEANNAFVDAAIAHCLSFESPYRQTLAEDIYCGMMYKAMCRGEGVPDKVFLLINEDDVDEVATLLILACSEYTKHRYQAQAKVPKEEPKTGYDEMIDWVDIISSKTPATKNRVLDRALTIVLGDRKWSSPLAIKILLDAGADWMKVEKENIHPLRKDLAELIQKHPAVRRARLMKVAKGNTDQPSERQHELKRPGI